MPSAGRRRPIWLYAGRLAVEKNIGAGALDNDLRAACLAAIGCAAADCRAHAETFTWAECARQFRDALHPIPRAAWQALKRRPVPDAAS